VLQLALRHFRAASTALLLFASPAAAEWHFAPLVGLTFKGDTTIVDTEQGAGVRHRSFGAAVSLLGDGIFGVETIVVLVPRFFESGDQAFISKSRSVAWMGNAVLTLPKRWSEYSLRPYLSAGFGVLNASIEDVRNVFPVDLNLKAYNVGGGATGFLTARTGLRFDLRYFSSLNGSDKSAASFGSEHLRYMTASIGVVIRR
jgi:hypothetical protein